MVGRQCQPPLATVVAHNAITDAALRADNKLLVYTDGEMHAVIIRDDGAVEPVGVIQAKTAKRVRQVQFDRVRTDRIIVADEHNLTAITLAMDESAS